MRRIWSIEGNTQRLDGGAMFGNAPRALWQRWADPDDHNRIPLACRAMLIEEARARGVEVAGAHHSYTATQSNLRSYTVPSWVVAGGDSAMVRRFDDPDTLPIIDRQTREMLAIRGGADHILFADQRPDLNGRTLADVAGEWGVSAPEAARRILRDGNAAVMNLGLYHAENTRYLAGLGWMMTGNYGRDPGPPVTVRNARAFEHRQTKCRDPSSEQE